MKNFLQNSRLTLKRFFLGSFFSGFIVSFLVFVIFAFYTDLRYQGKLLKRTADMELILRSEKEAHDAEVLKFIIKNREQKYEAELINASQGDLIDRLSALLNFLRLRIMELENIKPDIEEEKKEEKKPSRLIA